MYDTPMPIPMPMPIETEVAIYKFIKTYNTPEASNDFLPWLASLSRARARARYSTVQYSTYTKKGPRLRLRLKLRLKPRLFIINNIRYTIGERNQDQKTSKVYEAEVSESS